MVQADNHAQRGVEVVVPEFTYVEPDLQPNTNASATPFGQPDQLDINARFANKARHETGQDFFSSDVTDISESSMGVFLTGLLGKMPSAETDVVLDEMDHDRISGKNPLFAEYHEGDEIFLPDDDEAEPPDFFAPPAEDDLLVEDDLTEDAPVAILVPIGQRDHTGELDGLLAIHTVTSMEADLILNGPKVKKRKIFGR